MIFQQLAIPNIIELVCPFKCNKPLENGEWGRSKGAGRLVFPSAFVNSQFPIRKDIVTILNVIVLTGGLFHDC